MKKNGEYTTYHENGSNKTVEAYKKGEMLWGKNYYPNGKLESYSYLQGAKLHKETVAYENDDGSGRLIEWKRYEGCNLIEQLILSAVHNRYQCGEQARKLQPAIKDMVNNVGNQIDVTEQAIMQRMQNLAQNMR